MPTSTCARSTRRRRASNSSGLLRAMRTRGIDAVAMEVSSHALAIGRTDGCRFEAAAFTNVTQDHLDFHETMEAYRAAKARLFREQLRPGAAAVINLDDPASAEFLAAAREGGGRPICVARKPAPGVDISVLEAHVDLGGTRARLQLPSGPLDVEVPLLGDFNVENLLVAVGLAVGLEIAPAAIATGVASCPQVPGRVERVDDGRPDTPTVLVDYAHTPDAVDKLLRTVRPMARGRLITVFGCGGDRDRTKRAPMAEAVARWSDRAIATSDNPRSEAPEAILEDVVVGLAPPPARRARRDRSDRRQFRVPRRSPGRDRARAAHRAPNGHRGDRRQGSRGLPDHRARATALR